MADQIGAALVLIESSANQGFIFDTNKRREHVGASELISRVGGVWFHDAVRSATDGGQSTVTTLINTSGKVLARVEAEDAVEAAEAIVEAVTLRALREAPGLDVAGIVVGAGDDLTEASTAVHSQFQQARAARPGPAFRLLRLPPVAECRTSGLPASGFLRRRSRDDRDLRSNPSLLKLGAAEAGLERLAEEVTCTREELEHVTDYLETDATREHGAPWIGVVHADANGLGALFQDAELFDTPEEVGRFSRALEQCSLDALTAAADRLPRRIVGGTANAPIRSAALLPLVRGGDDLTVVCDGRDAVTFAVEYLRAWADTTSDGDAGSIARKRFANGHLGACAGVAIVKPHFPFATAYGLAESLCAEAKALIRDRVDDQGRALSVSAVDFHLHFDTSGTELADVRRRMIAESGRSGERAANAALWGGPYIVTAGEGEAAADDLAARDWEHLLAARDALLETDDDQRRVLPRGQVRALRSATTRGVGPGEAAYARLLTRYGTAAAALGHQPAHGHRPTLFRDDHVTRDRDGVSARTLLLDALALEELA